MKLLRSIFGLFLLTFTLWQTLAAPVDPKPTELSVQHQEADRKPAIESDALSEEQMVPYIPITPIGGIPYPRPPIYYPPPVPPAPFPPFPPFPPYPPFPPGRGRHF
ncbi:hypothetical protein EC973_004016 [Apophysomyces ossiformis]|uniref:Uncharacterized protein n=1 Tax=Apophysomyces ossiformis TaxID=679940 RepID=A0A8H7ES18_9FUNG|nr:hypothetical protein EC973_004016 [Apophysomyces ossiformis]